MSKLITSLGLALGIVTASNTQAADVTLNLGYGTAEGSSYSILANKFEELAEKYSNGSIDIKVRCCTQLSTEDEAFKSMQLGIVDMYIITSNNISPHFPLMDAFVLPYIFQSENHTRKVLQGPIGEEFANRLQQDTGVYLLTYGHVGHRDFYNTERPINNFSDLAGIKVRVPKNEVMIKTYEAFGSAPLPLAWSDTPTALQTGTVQGADNGTDVIKSQKFYEIAPQLAVLEHFSYFSPLFASSRAIGKLNDEQRQAVFKAAKEAGEYANDIIGKDIDETRQFLANNGMKITYPDKAPFIAAALKIQEEIAAEKDDDFRDLLNKINRAAQ
ncbi:TRAP transporter substrate-binding protein [Zobellella maritima]|uniref:TRAP transporter substrate-binding protein n=1 Tax=Zobellella maritima TaxID=2059725 RepID=UPI0018E515B6|nr:TRAP transporter substrate-binding protein [Zobellella maritima]